jgi:subtilisin-like proprotein convertase family protein
MMNMRFGVVLAALAFGLSGCKGGGTSGSPSGMPTVTYSVGGTVTGLTGAGLVLRVNGAGNLAIAAGGSFAFASPIPAGTIYTVTVFAQPAGQTCTVANGSGTVTAPVTNIAVTCGVTIGGTVTGLSGTLVLRNNGGNDLTIATNSAFTFSNAVVTGSPYNVTVFSKPSNQSCNVANGSGTVGATNVTNVTVTCAVNGFSIGTVSDPLATQQWHLKNTGQFAFADSGGVADMDINVDPVYSTFGFTGSGVITAVVDTGLEIAHEDLAANVVSGGSWNFLNNTTDPTNTIDADGDHGTSVAGLIAAARNTVGGIGVAPRASFKGFNFLSIATPSVSQFISATGGSSSNPNSSDVHIVNESFGISPTNDTAIIPSVENHLIFGVNQLRGGKGALYVKAAGNGFYDMGVTGNANCFSARATQSLASDGTLTGLSCENANFDPENVVPYQIVVGATNASGVRSSYSSAGSAIWVSAPGGEFGRNAAQFGAGGPAADYQPAMVTTDQSTCAKGYSTNTVQNGSAFDNGAAPNAACNYTNGMNGTSSATPVTVGVIALMLEANPALTWRDVKHILAMTARQIDSGRAAVSIALTGGSYVAEPQWTTNLVGRHFHNWYGFGMVDASAAVNMARTYTAGQFGTFTNTGFIASPTLNFPIPEASAVGVENTLNVPVTAGVQVIEAVQISVNVTHTAVGDLGIELISPSGTRSVVKNIRDGFAKSNDLNGMVLLSNAFYGETAAGNWKIKVVDGEAIDTGTLVSWSIRIFGH